MQQNIIALRQWISLWQAASDSVTEKICFCFSAYYSLHSLLMNVPVIISDTHTKVLKCAKKYVTVCMRMQMCVFFCVSIIACLFWDHIW